MAAWTLEEAKTNLKMWLDADAKVATGQSFTINDGGSQRSITRVDAARIQEKINFWSRQVARLQRGGSIRQVTPHE